MSVDKQIEAQHLQLGIDTILGIDPSQAPNEPALLGERLSVAQKGITESLEMLYKHAKSRHLQRGAPLVYVMLEAASRAFPGDFEWEITQKSFVTSVAASGPEAKLAVETPQAPIAADAIRSRQPVLAKFIDEQLLAPNSFASKFTVDERTGIYALCLGTIRTIDRALQGAEKPVQVTRLPGRNDPCHCGSGKKFKKCHG